MATKKKSKTDGLAFEVAMEQLEEIVELMEAEKMPLEQLVTSYEKGTGLLKVCEARIAEAQERIEMIAKKAGARGGLEVADFDPDRIADGGEESGSTGESSQEEEDDGEVRLL